MSNVRLVVSDVDGTLVAKHSHEASERTRAAIARIQMNGGHVAIATARPAEYAQAVVERFSLRGPQVVDGGASVYDYDKDEYVWRQWLEIQKLLEIVRAIEGHFRAIDCFPDFRVLEAKEFDEVMIAKAAPYVYVQIDHEDHNAAWQNLSKIENIAYDIVSHDDTYDDVQICHRDATKRHGVEQLQRILGILKSETLAIGDGDNDVALFETADHCVAMGNATETLKAKATYVTDMIEHDGWTKSMRQFDL